MNEYRAEVRRQEPALEARYEAINQAWKASGIPAFVRETPDWESGYRVLMDWLGRHDSRGQDPKLWAKICANSPPKLQAIWAEEIHIFSHMMSREQGHHSAHASIEEEGANAVLTWWQQRR